MSSPVSARQAVLVALAFSAIAYLNADTRVDWLDEGYLWCGAINTHMGQVPIRDFQAYDPGRYYWCAAVFSVLGNGLMALREAAILFQFFCLSAALLALRRGVRSVWALVGAGLLLYFWMIVPFRYFDSGIPLVAVFLGVRFLEKTSWKRSFSCGAWAGLASFFGVNHGLYLFVGFYALLAYAIAKGAVDDAMKKRIAFGFGFAAGTLPILAMLLGVPGFYESYAEHLMRLGGFLKLGVTNIPLPVPWPWTFSWQTFGRLYPDIWVRLLGFANALSIGTALVLLFLFYVFAFPAVLRVQKGDIRGRAVFIVPVWIGAVYLHHVFSRAESLHIGEAFFPVILGVWSLQGAYPSFNKVLARALVALVTFVSFLAAGLQSNLLLKNFSYKKNLVRYPVGKELFWMLKADAAFARGIQKVVAAHVRPDEPVLLAPLLATFYPMLGKQPPVYEVYFGHPQTEKIQWRMIRQLEEKKVNWAIIGDQYVDNIDELRLSQTHVLLWRYLATNFEILPAPELQKGYVLARRKVFLT